MNISEQKPVAVVSNHDAQCGEYIEETVHRRGNRDLIYPFF